MTRLGTTALVCWVNDGLMANTPHWITYLPPPTTWQILCGLGLGARILVNVLSKQHSMQNYTKLISIIFSSWGRQGSLAFSTSQS